MNFLTLLILSIGLSFDTFAVSVSSGLIRKEIIFWQAVRIAIILAVFQALMPVIGWFGGVSIKSYIEPIDHWIAFGLLVIIGVKMITESFKDNDSKSLNPTKLKVILVMAFATSIDALVVGISFAIVEVNLVVAIVTIGFVTFLASMLGILCGKKSGARLGMRMEILGGAILIGIGIKILLEHQSFL
jgi:putative Mn2+ efflux pump MntP